MESFIVVSGRLADDVQHGDGADRLEAERQITGSRVDTNKLPDNARDDAILEATAYGNADAFPDARRLRQLEVPGWTFCS
jgi:hypothetical protein